MTAIKKIIFTLMTLIVFVIPVLVQEDGDPVSIGTFQILPSKILDEDRTLLVNLPRVMRCASFETADFKLLLAHARCQDLDRLMEAEVIGRRLPDGPLQTWRRRTGSILPDQVAPERLVTGDDLLAIGLAAGPAVGRLLDDLYRRQLNGRLTSREQALTIARELIARQG